MSRPRFALLFIILVVLTACPGAEDSQEEKTYDLRGTIVSRLPERNFITVNHEAIPQVMEPMTMAYEVKGQKVTDLPPDGAHVSARLHITGDGYWLTNVTTIR
ncbi:MAG: copper-binding protein [Acidobacteriota bacterium]